MKHLSVLIVFILSIHVSQAQAWKLNLSDSVSVTTPIQLHDTLLNNLTLKFGVKPDHSSSFTAMLVNYKPYGLTESMVSSMAPTHDFKEQFKKGFLGSMPGAVMLSDTSATYHGKYTYYDFVISTTQYGLPIKMYVRSLFYKALGVNLFYTLPESYTGSLAERDKFFNSIMLVE